MSKAILSSTYFGPIQWYQKLVRHSDCFIEQHESFVKQTYRNRCVIASANGPLSLTIPVERGVQPQSNGKTLMKDMRISDHANWRHVHWNALVSAYNDSPFFEYYADDLRPFFEKKYRFLFDFNWEITTKMCELLHISPNIQPTTSFVESCDETNFRELIRPKNAPVDPDFTSKPYYQVYQQRHGFLENMSIIDLLCNEGNESILYLI